MAGVDLDLSKISSMPCHQPVCREVARSNSILVGAVELVGFSNLGVFDQRSNRVTSVSSRSFQGPLSQITGNS